jgi:signal transduction histidine kinase
MNAQRQAWWRLNTLGVRLFVLLWAALVVAHYAGYAIHDWHGAHGGSPNGHAGPRPGGALPSRPPPLQALPPADGLPPPGQPRPAPGDGGRDIPRGGEPAGADDPEHFGPSALIDYGVRILVFGAAAWLGAWWVVRPLRRLNEAADRLDQAVGQGQALAPIDDQKGPQELRDTARVFNDMARRLNAQFEERSMMMAAVSHDLRTPMTRLRLRLERMDEGPLRQAQRADLAQMEQMVSQVLDAMRQERTQEALVRLDLLALVQAAVDDLHETGAAVQCGSDLPAEVMAEPQALRRVLDNLLGNALQHGRSASVSLQSGQGWVSVFIDDEGPGIVPEQLELVFKPFHRVDASRQQTTGGVGLGLYIARQLTQRQGGHLHLMNRPAGGLRAVLRLPDLDGRR